MLISCLAIAGGCFVLGWSKLSSHYNLKVKAALERVVSVNATNRNSSKGALREWQTILSTHSLSEVLAILTEDSAEG